MFKRETKKVLKFIQKNKEYIDGVYGAPKDWILDGGRHKIAVARLTTDKPYELLKDLNKLGIKFSLVCNTSLDRAYFKNLETNKPINNFLQEMLLLNRYFFRKHCPAGKAWEWNKKDLFKMLDCGIRRFKIAGRTELLGEVINGIGRNISYFKEYIRNKE